MKFLGEIVTWDRRLIHAYRPSRRHLRVSSGF